MDKTAKPLRDLSIILPVLNEAEGIRATLETLQPLRAEGCEVIVVDGGSTDGTPALAATLADRAITAPRGRARQMNAGAVVAAGDLLLFLHADTRLPPDAAAIIRTALEVRPWGRFDVRILDRHGRRPRVLQVVAGMMNLRSRLTGIATGDQAIFCRRAAFEAVGGYPDQPLMEDIELSRRLKRLAPPACLPGPVETSARRWEGYGVIRTILLMWRLRLLYRLGVPAERLAGRYPPCSR